VDQRVPLDHAEKYVKALEEAGKDYQYVELDWADHFSNTLFYDHKIVLYESLLAYLQNECNLGNTVSTAAR
jgi:dipeptidyl aminopeptidase/acylaminoacyl peptidase